MDESRNGRGSSPRPKCSRGSREVRPVEAILYIRHGPQQTRLQLSQTLNATPDAVVDGTNLCDHAPLSGRSCRSNWRDT